MKHILMVILCSVLFSAPSFAEWKWIGPEAGYIEQLIPDRNHAGLWYAVNNGRLYRSMNNGTTWKPTAMAGLAKMSYPGSPYLRVPPVGIQYKSSTVFVASPDGVWASTDLGKTFVQRGTDRGLPMQKVFPHPKNANLLYGFDGVGLLLSKDGGISWNYVNNLPYEVIPPPYSCSFDDMDLLFSPFGSSTIYVSGQQSCSWDGENWYDPFLFASYNSGKTWNRLESNHYTFASDRLISNSAYAYPTGDVGGYSKILRLTAAGWQQANIDPNWYELFDVALIPHSPESVLAVAGYIDEKWNFTRGVFLSKNRGATWSLIQSGPLAERLHLARAIDSDGTELLGGSRGGGVYRGALTGPWTGASRGFREFWTNYLSQAKDGTLVAMQQWLDSFAYQYRPDTQTWNNLNFKLLSRTEVVLQNPNVADHLISAGHGVNVSRDAGTTWQPSGYVQDNWFNTGCFDPIHSSKVYLSIDYGYIWKSNNGGSTFEQTDIYPAANLTADPSVSGVLYFVQYGDVMRSMDGGKTAEPANEGLESYVWDLYPLGVPGDYLALTFDGVYRTGNGKTWHYFASVPPDMGAGKIRSADPMASHLYLIDGYYQFLFESYDRGNSWTNITPELGPDTYVLDMTDPQHPPFRVATNHGVFELSQ